MATAVKTKLPLDLLRIAYRGVRKCVRVAENAIHFDRDKKRFEGDVLRIMASPVKDVIPDMQLEIYIDVARAYLDEGDTTNADIFIRQGLLISRSNKKLLEMREELRDLLARSTRH